MICGSTVASWFKSSCWLMPVRCDSSLSTFWPKAPPSCAGLNGLILPRADPGIDLRRGAAGGELADEIGKTTHDAARRRIGRE